LDYEDALQRVGFRMRVQVFDGRFIATATIDVRLDDRNDNAPELHGPRTANITESAPINTEIARFVVIDRDLDGHDTAKYADDGDIAILPVFGECHSCYGAC
jgi:hypothetical protein